MSTTEEQIRKSDRKCYVWAFLWGILVGAALMMLPLGVPLQKRTKELRACEELVAITKVESVSGYTCCPKYPVGGLIEE